ncbi:MAG: PKD domain-containing protein [Flavipsychrobacter sp.]|nr:PKD domain-containing protein [Flavipsychrobacter sp.]
MQLNFIKSIANKRLLCLFGLLAINTQGRAQLPTCSGANAGLIYYVYGTTIYNLDPTLPISATNPVVNTISLPTGAIAALSLGPNLNAVGPSPTFYTVAGPNNYYYYYNGSSWTNTGFTTGSSFAVNPGGGGSFIYNNAGGGIYKYNGSANGTLLTTLTGLTVADVAADCRGDFYILKNGATSELDEYSPTGTVLNTWTISGPATSGGGGLAVINNSVYYCAGANVLYGGTISGTTINVSALGTLSPAPSDFASCPVSTTVIGKTDTVYACSGGAGVPVTAPGIAPFTWTVVSGPATITGTGATVSVTASANSVIVAQFTSATSCGATIDTFKIIVPTALVSTGLPATITGCGTYTNTLNATLSDTTAGLTYQRAWTPAIAISSGGNTLTPVTHLFTNTKLTLTISTPFNQGGCSFTDTGTIYVIDKSVKAKFTDTVHYGCAADTLYLTNKSTAQTSQIWNFGDNTTSTLLNPTHLYTSQGHYSTLLTVTNGTCTDSVRATVDTPHIVHASFTASLDTICQGQTITFTNISSGIYPSYTWRFGDGSTDTNASPNHTFNHEGVFLVKVVEKDFVPCYDSSTLRVFVDSVSFLKFTTSDTVLCQGQGITFTGQYINIGNTGNSWDFGDGTVITNRNPVEHGYLEPGTYPITLTAKFRVCPDTTIKKNVSIFAYPAINIGSDTSMCPNGNPIQLTDIVNAGHPGATWQWNTGDTSSTITASQPGVYYATVSVNGCAASDSVWIKNDCYLSIPNSFTPNNDGINDYFFPRQKLSEGLVTFKFNIYNRWGQLIYQTTNIDGRGWDGKFNSLDQPVGVYIYTIDATYKDGESESYKGNVTLLR